MSLTLVIGNKNYSSWSLRAWAVLRSLGIPFQEEQHFFEGFSNAERFRPFSPSGRVPCLYDDATVVWDSLAIIEYLDAVRPTPRLVPKDAILAAKVRAVALAIACDTHPLTNLRVAGYLATELKVPPDSIEAWRRFWNLEGLQAVERLIAPAPFCFSAEPTLADVCLIPQLFAARRFATPLDHLPRILSVEAACLELEAFKRAHPARQADAE